MSDDKPIMEQIHEYENLVGDILNEGMKMCEILQANVLLEKFPPSWSDYRNQLKHKKRDLSLQELINHMKTEEANRLKDKHVLHSVNSVNANVVEFADKNRSKGKEKRFQKNGQQKTHTNINKADNKIQKRKVDCYVCGRTGHKAYQCQLRKGQQYNNSKSAAPSAPQAHLAENEEVIAAVVVEANLVDNKVDWILDTGASKHLCANKELFHQIEDAVDGECVFMGNSATAGVLGKGKILLKLTSGKTLSLSDVLYVPSLRRKLISGSCLNRAGLKLVFEADKVVITKNGNFVGKGYLADGLFVLNTIPKTSNAISSVGSVYIAEFLRLNDNSICESRNAEFFEQEFPLTKHVNELSFSSNTTSVPLHLPIYSSVANEQVKELRRSKRKRIESSFGPDFVTAFLIENNDVDKVNDAFAHYIEKILKKFNCYDELPVKTPYDPSIHLKKNNGSSVSQTEYAKIIGSVMFLMNCTRPDIAYAVSRLSRYTHNPGNEHWTALRRLLRYLKGTMDWCLHFYKFPAVLEGFCDANWVTDNDEARCVNLGGQSAI
ncbi:unnamed protein product [Trifolium pratense]|uniref:Uncharacterized protein n=1 Tax=Trifolium pratense TaxID=57577 RepID=A0ACB0IXS4_TRIPR|nr:unnamed protein product [Trifolium pratense]